MQSIMRYFPAPWPSVILLLVVLYLTLTPMPLPPFKPIFSRTDLIVHFIMFGTLSAVFAYDTRRKTNRPLSAMTAVVIIVSVIALGGIIELLQGTTLINRSCDLYDFIVNSIGATTIGTASYFINRRNL